VKVWSWRHAVQRAKLAPTTKLVLLNLSIEMNDVGESCFPSTAKQARDTGLSERSVCTHLEIAVEAGFITKKFHGYGSQRWARHEYQARYPKGTELGSVPRKEGTEGGSAEGTEPDDKKALKDVQCTSPSTSPVNSPAGSFQKRCDKGSGFRIDHVLTDAARERARANAPGWDMQRLMNIFDTSIRAGVMQPPKNPDAAFPAWCKAYTKGKRP